MAGRAGATRQAARVLLGLAHGDGDEERGGGESERGNSKCRWQLMGDSQTIFPALANRYKAKLIDAKLMLSRR
eukprot:5656207-Pyramimonas_sp.AAC.1